MEDTEKHAGKSGPNVALYIAIIYAALVLIGAIGQLFGIGWIQAIPIYRGP